MNLVLINGAVYDVRMVDDTDVILKSFGTGKEQKVNLLDLVQNDHDLYLFYYDGVVQFDSWEPDPLLERRFKNHYEFARAMEDLVLVELFEGQNIYRMFDTEAEADRYIEASWGDPKKILDKAHNNIFVQI